MARANASIAGLVDEGDRVYVRASLRVTNSPAYAVAIG